MVLHRWLNFWYTKEIWWLKKLSYHRYSSWHRKLFPISSTWVKFHLQLCNVIEDLWSDSHLASVLCIRLCRYLCSVWLLLQVKRICKREQSACTGENHSFVSSPSASSLGSFLKKKNQKKTSMGKPALAYHPAERSAVRYLCKVELCHYLLVQ